MMCACFAVPIGGHGPLASRPWFWPPRGVVGVRHQPRPGTLSGMLAWFYRPTFDLRPRVAQPPIWCRRSSISRAWQARGETQVSMFGCTAPPTLRTRRSVRSSQRCGRSLRSSAWRRSDNRSERPAPSEWDTTAHWASADSRHERSILGGPVSTDRHTPCS
jgi:hypothetical protein